jgi:hypothetical protein
VNNSTRFCYFATEAWIVTSEAKDRVEDLISTLFGLRNAFASLNYYVVPSQRLSLKNQKIDISLSKD